jgi:S-adenosylmethionine/arginine decarboxylase-like enzyme
MLQEYKEKEIFGYELCIDLYNCDAKTIRSKTKIKQFVKKLCKEIDMIPYGESIVVNFGSGQAKGYSLVQLIETSSIVGHFKEENNSAYIDIFSCKEFDSLKTESFTQEFFGASSVKSTFLVRG